MLGVDKMRRTVGVLAPRIGPSRTGKFRLRRTDGLCCWLKKIWLRKVANGRRKSFAPMHTKPTGSDCSTVWNSCRSHFQLEAGRQ
jgi:hypothetical protein